MSLWIAWWDPIWLLRPAFSRLRAFMWFAITVAGLTVRTDSLGVTGIVRALKLRPRLYNKLLDHFHSDAVQLDRLSALWTQAALRLFPQPLRVNGRRVLVGDGIKVAKCGKKMPSVKLLHQQSESNTKPEYIMGHSLQAVSMLVHAANSVLAVPLAVRIHEGLIWSNRDRRTLLDKMLSLLGIVAIKDPFYFVGDAFYAARKLAKGLYDQNNHLVSRVKSNALAFAPYATRPAQKRSSKALRRQAPAQITAQRSQDHAIGYEPSLWRGQRHDPVSGQRFAVASLRSARTLCRRRSPFQRFVPADVHRHLIGRHRDHSSLWIALQDRTQLQAGCTQDRLIRIPLLDARYEAASSWGR
jgi:hypothetical protein